MANRSFSPAESRSVGVALVVYGLLLAPLGLLGLALPGGPGAPGALMLGCLFLVAGLSGWATLWLDRDAPAFAAHAIWAGIAVAAGLVGVIAARHIGQWSSMVFGLAFLGQGAAATAYALDHRRSGAPGSLTMLAGAAGTALLGALLLTGYPFWDGLAGAIIAVDLVSFGVSVLFSGLYRRRRAARRD